MSRAPSPVVVHGRRASSSMNFASTSAAPAAGRGSVLSHHTAATGASVGRGGNAYDGYTPAPSATELPAGPIPDDFTVGRPPRNPNNVLLKKDLLGIPNTKSVLPESIQPGHIFGKRYPGDVGGVAACVQSWDVHCPPPKKIEYDFGRDFVALNRESAPTCPTSPQVRVFRQEHDIRLKPKKTKNAAGESTSPRLLRRGEAPVGGYGIGSNTYSMRAAGGDGSPAPEDMPGVLSHKYQLLWVQGQLERNQRTEVHQSVARRASPAPKTLQERLEPLRQAAATPHPKEWFNMAEFVGIEGRCQKGETPVFHAATQHLATVHRSMTPGVTEGGFRATLGEGLVSPSRVYMQSVRAPSSPSRAFRV